MKKIYSILLTALVALAVTSCVKDEVYPYATVKSLTNTESSLVSDPVTVTLQATALVDVTSAKLFYSVAGGEFQSVDMQPIVNNEKSFSADIPGNIGTKGQEVCYYAQVFTSSGKATTSAVNKFTIAEKAVDYTGLIINELNGNDKFIELYNSSANDINISKIQLFKDNDNGGDGTAKWTAPEKTLKAGKYLLLYSSDVEASHPEQDKDLFFSAGLSAKKPVQITIKGPGGETIDDVFTTNASAYAGSFGRNADGKWYYQPTATPKAKNEDGTDLLPLK